MSRIVEPDFIGKVIGEKPYTCTKDWPDGFVFQFGSLRTVLQRKPEVGVTAFFEAYFGRTNLHIRYEGPTVEEAEAAAWNSYQKILDCEICDAHQFERRGYKDGFGVCVHCGVVRPCVFEVVNDEE